MVVLRTLVQVRNLNSLSATITRPHRLYYMKLYPTVMVNTDGSTFTIRYHEPRQIVKLPVNIWTLSEAERKLRLEQRKPKKKVKIVDDLDDDYNSSKYLKYLKK